MGADVCRWRQLTSKNHDGASRRERGTIGRQRGSPIPGATRKGGANRAFFNARAERVVR